MSAEKLISDDVVAARLTGATYEAIGLLYDISPEKARYHCRRAAIAARVVMSLIGPMLDAFEQVPNDVLGMDELEDLCVAIEAINFVMENAE